MTINICRGLLKKSNNFYNFSKKLVIFAKIL